MYQNRFGLHRKPFQTVLSDDDFFRSAAFDELAPTVLHALRSDLGVAVLTGPDGSGKSTTLEYFRRALSTDSQTLVLRGGTAGSASELLQSLYRTLLKSADDAVANESRQSVRRWDIVERLQRVTDFWGPLLILVDDAHLISPEAFAELRSLLEEEANGRKIVRLLISGSLELEEVLAKPAMSDFARKIRSYVFLQPLTSAESVAYLSQQIAHAGGDPAKILDPKAIELLVSAAGGIPRCLNLLADESLMVCEESDQDHVTASVVNSALRRLQHLPVSWNAVAADELDERSNDSNSDAANLSGGDSVIEIGGLSDAASGVVEFGATEDVQPGNTRPIDIEICAGVVEIGAEPEPDVAVEFSAHDADPVTPEICDQQSDDYSEAPESDAVDLDFLLPAVDEASVASFEYIPEDEEPETITSAADGLDDQSDFMDDVDVLVCDQLSAPAHRDVEEDELVTETQQAEEVDACVGREPFPDSQATTWRDLSEQEDAGESVTTEFSAGVVHDVMVCESELNDESVDRFNLLLEANEETLKEIADESVMVTFGDFQPWEPSGCWPAPQFPADVEQAVPVLTATVLPEVRHVNKTPVFDRYTWCELDRPVCGDVTARIASGIGEVAERLVWPPEVKGVAPIEPIPIQAFADSDPVVDESVLDAEIQQVAKNLADVVSERPDEAITQIQDVIQDEVIQDIEFPQQESGIAVSNSSSVLGQKEIWVRGQLVNEPDDATQRLLEHELEAISESLSGSTCAESDSTPADGGYSDQADASGQPDGEEAAGDCEPDYIAGESVVYVESRCQTQFDSELLEGRADSSDCLVLPNEDRTPAADRCQVDAYKPRLLSEAKSRLSGLAESLGQRQSEDVHRQEYVSARPTEITGVASQVDVQPESCPSDSAGCEEQAPSRNKFSDLFTRLRGLKNRSA